jgi:hypothetical protein
LALFVELVERGINLELEDILYNYIDATSMTKSQTQHVFRVVTEFHVITLHVLINVWLPPNYVIVDFNYGLGSCFHPSLLFLDSKLFLQPFVLNFCITGNNIRAYQELGRLILAVKVDS